MCQFLIYFHFVFGLSFQFFIRLYFLVFWISNLLFNWCPMFLCYTLNLSFNYFFPTIDLAVMYRISSNIFWTNFVISKYNVWYSDARLKLVILPSGDRIMKSRHALNIWCGTSLKPQYIYQDSNLLASVVCFAELVQTGL